MRLRDLLKYDDIVVQCHDNPDADAIASGYGVYLYLKNQGKQVRFVYAGRFRIQKSNLLLMISELAIPIEYVEKLDCPELLVMVDCQYGEGNVTRFEAKSVAVIDHHQISGEHPKFGEVRSHIGACATVVRELYAAENLDVNEDKNLATALYYGLLMDTNNFTEIFHPADKDLRDYTDFERSQIIRFRNSNLSLDELEIAGKALLDYEHNARHRYAVLEAKPCDPNILGMISDIILEVDVVDTSLVYSVQPFGVKISVRSCVKEVKASELAEYITEGIGSGGGHLEKAGGFINTELWKKVYPSSVTEKGMHEFLSERMKEYFEKTTIIYAKDYDVEKWYGSGLSALRLYQKKRILLGYVKASEMFEPGETVCVRTLEGDLDVRVEEDTYIMIGINGEIYPNKKEKFERSYRRVDQPYVFEGEYPPTVKDLAEGKNLPLIPHARACIPTGESYIYAKTGPQSKDFYGVG